MPASPRMTTAAPRPSQKREQARRHELRVRTTHLAQRSKSKLTLTPPNPKLMPNVAGLVRATEQQWLEGDLGLRHVRLRGNTLVDPRDGEAEGRGRWNEYFTITFEPLRGNGYAI